MNAAKGKPYAYDSAAAKIAVVEKDMKDWQELATSTDIEVESASAA